ncbi:CD109 antigen-like [Bombina bombina]|uniref:CD109 antigen-like n=1 Tax=Bombina bombina TaxID=8345 RepID=UPI00235AAB21|nr:CD109 antigen-like [Bombina bombina]
MHIQWPPPLKSIVFIGFFLHIAAEIPSHYIIAPSYLTPLANTKLAVHWFGSNHSEVNIFAAISNQDNQLVNVSSVFRNDSIGILSLPPVPQTSSQSYQLTVNGTAQGTLVFSYNIPIAIDQRIYSVFIQTDKVVYKPGQTVKIRVISIDRDLKPHNGDVNLRIVDPQNNIIQQWLNLKTDMGVVSTEFALSNNLMYGSWGIQAETSNSMAMAYITVEEYVLPRFEVNLNTPFYYISPKQQNLTGTVTAKYTYGKAVNGNLTIIIQPMYSYGNVIEIRKTYMISGSANFSIAYEEIAGVLNWGALNITASVTEELTGVVNNASTQVQSYNSEYILRGISTQQFFSPGSNFTAKLQILRIDNKALLAEERQKKLSVKITQSVNRYWFSFSFIEEGLPVEDSFGNTTDMQYDIPESGIISIQIPVLASTQQILIQAEYENATMDQNYVLPFSEVNTYALIQTTDSPIQVGTPFQIHVDTYPRANELFYVVSAKGIIVSTGRNMGTSFTLTPEQSWAPSALLTVYFLNLNSSYNNIVQDTKLLTINGTFKNKVSLSWSKSKAEPAENVSLAINVKEARSLVGLRIVDKSAILLGQGNDLTASLVENRLTDFNKGGTFNTLTDGIIGSFNIMYEEIPYLTTSVSQPMQPIGHVRTFFPETWIWLESNISSGNTKNLQVTVPDSITTWVASAFVISEGLGLGLIDEPVELQAFKPFFISLNMPYSVTRGEQFILEVILFNYLAENIQVVVTLESSNSYEIIVVNNNATTVPGKHNVTVPSQDGKTVLFPIKPIQLGEIAISVTAVSSAASDAISQILLVNAEGIKNYYSQTILLEGNGSSEVSQNLSFTFPIDVVNGSQQAYVLVIGDLLGPSIDGLASLIQMPYGCGEQNMINFAPNIFVLQYLIATNQITAEIRTKAITFMNAGYQAELTYMRSDGSFSAFGNSDASGSSWLTAYVLKCFLQARPFIYINAAILEQSMNWLIQNQDSNTGIFSEPGRVIHSELQGGLNGPITLTAYIITTLLEDAIYANLYKERIQKAVQYLESKFDEGISSNYSLSIVTYALTVANSTKASTALTQLNSRANNIGGTKFWSSPSETTSYWQPRTTDIETSAYALLSHYRQNRINEGIPIMKWLSQQRNHLGGYASTQDTIIALQALAQFSVLVANGNTALTVTVTGQGSFIPKSFKITNENLLVQQSHQIQVSQPLSIRVSAVGRGLAIFQLNVVYNQKPSARRKRDTSSTEAFQLKVTVVEDQSNINLLSVVVCTSTLGGRESGMVLLEVEYLSGFTLSSDGILIQGSLKMVEKKDDKVYLYFDSITETQVCVTVPMVRTAKVAASQDAVVKISDYYNPRNTATRTYNSQTMMKISTCDFCGFNCSACRSNVEVKATVTTLTTPTSSANSPKMFVIWFFTLCIYSLFIN